MNLPATSAAESTQANDQAAINELLGEDGQVADTPGEEVNAEDPREEADAAAAEDGAEKSEPAESEDGSGEAADEDGEPEESEDEPAEDAEEESDFTPDERDRDYSQAAYEKAALHYSKTHKIQLDPQDPAHRVLLKEIMDRGRELSAQRALKEADEKAKTDEGRAADEETVRQAARPTPEQIQQGLAKIQEYAKQRVVPEVAMHVTNRFVKALWPKEKVTVSQEQANDFASALHEFFIMALDDAAPAVYGMVNQSLGNDPVWGTVQQQAIDASAFERLDKNLGAERFADMERLVTNGTIKSIIDKNQNLFRGIVAGDGKDPVANRAAQIEAAYKFARGENALEEVSRAVKTGEKKASDKARKIAAGRTSPGTPKGGFNRGTTESQDVVNQITRGEGSGSRFSNAVKSQIHKTP